MPAGAVKAAAVAAVTAAAAVDMAAEAVVPAGAGSAVAVATVAKARTWRQLATAVQGRASRSAVVTGSTLHVALRLRRLASAGSPNLLGGKATYPAAIAHSFV